MRMRSLHKHIEFCVAAKKDPSLRSLFLHLSGNRLMPQYLGKAVLATVVDHIYRGHQELPANSKLPGKDGTLGSGGGYGPRGCWIHEWVPVPSVQSGLFNGLV